MPFDQQLNFTYPTTIEQLCEDLQNKHMFKSDHLQAFLNYVTTDSRSPLKDAETLKQAYDKAIGRDVEGRLLSVISRSPQTYLTDGIVEKIRGNSDLSKEQKFVDYALKNSEIFCADSSQLLGLLSIADENQQKNLFKKALKEQFNFTIKEVDSLLQLVAQVNSLFTDEQDQLNYQQLLLNTACRQGLAKDLSQCNLRQLQSNFNHFQYLFNKDRAGQVYDNLFKFAKEQCQHNFHVKQLVETFAESEKQQDLMNLAIGKGVNSWLDARIILESCTDQQAKINFFDQCVLPQFSDLIRSHKQLGEIITQAPDEQTERQLIDKGFEHSLIEQPAQLRRVIRSLNTHQSSENFNYLFDHAFIHPNKYILTIQDAVKFAELTDNDNSKKALMSRVIIQDLYQYIDDNNASAFKNAFNGVSIPYSGNKITTDYTTDQVKEELQRVKQISDAQIAALAIIRNLREEPQEESQQVRNDPSPLTENENSLFGAGCEEPEENDPNDDDPNDDDNRNDGADHSP